MIRKFKEEDTVKVMTLWTKGNFKAHPFIEKDYWLENFNKVKNEYLYNSETYVYIENEEIKGFISLLDNGYIGALFVRNDCQREGIGRRLINYVKERNPYLKLQVYEKNIDATLFYVAMGFKNTKIQIDEDTRRKGICNGMEEIIKELYSHKIVLLLKYRNFYIP